MAKSGGGGGRGGASGRRGGNGTSPGEAIRVSQAEVDRLNAQGLIKDREGNTYLIRTEIGDGRGFTFMNVPTIVAKRRQLPNGVEFSSNEGRLSRVRLPNTAEAIAAVRAIGGTRPAGATASYFVQTS